MAYRLSGKKSGAISFLPATGTITQETMTKSSKMTSNAIEGGSSIEDHVYLNPEQFQIVGVVVKTTAPSGPDWRQCGRTVIW